ncbi:YbaK/prolyl-tRNA synthetase associated region OS=Tsukamurella paurometabola (strain ATCC 8368 / DSM / CCUG 35730 / CIP 100753 / JCM 10117 / KCTC 9821 /NBRC 16120 / NCIMB 702349 / NCTC 13040) OX=521096 GN=Tpau_0548 PE=4 SV=1 [Tsukamurella paurometabola]|uniref:YbaK/prolyl-tRNA synthetase associated region n=1 Tax=Tsukamurella paurometabola (strain ATCC 8368 / DSM 20162 / CCUG 35730 / CIP 100753 / JCM 10117 / KCTC 9821 / NBRC 16120 / NCIMB 702349 / NCTC 13040) TaxID=521096 RepID=D5USC1_TSUPD|nr:YbaK/EbsC family protein [Tsukamurella paurometabola]ADG77188.1 YbaK/prolyl-tRNA synthetase associated region [Tsukamurella paurometabola DSM 20162]SUP43099.1 Proline--tRNA ligase [Tsukamurella paurometabola]
MTDADQSSFSRRTEAVRAALVAAGHPDTVRVVPGGAATAAEAAAALGCEVGAIANSLIFLADGAPLLVLSSGRHRVDTAGLAERLGHCRISRATPDDVVAATGQVIGGVSPVGHPSALRTVIDESLRDYPDLYAAAGTHDTLFRTDFDALVALTGAAIVRTSA